jgi:hypothetical protein
VTRPSPEQDLAAARYDGEAFGRLVAPCRFDGSGNLLLRYEVGPATG